MAEKKRSLAVLLCWIGWHKWDGCVRSNFGYGFDYCSRCRKRRNEVREED